MAKISEIMTDAELREKTLRSISSLENPQAYFLKSGLPAKSLNKLNFRKLLRNKLYKTDQYDQVMVKGSVYAKDLNGHKLMEYPRFFVVNLPEANKEFGITDEEK